MGITTSWPELHAAAAVPIKRQPSCWRAVNTTSISGTTPLYANALADCGGVANTVQMLCHGY